MIQQVKELSCPRAEKYCDNDAVNIEKYSPSPQGKLIGDQHDNTYQMGAAALDIVWALSNMI